MGVYPRPMSLVTPMSGFRKGVLPLTSQKRLSIELWEGLSWWHTSPGSIPQYHMSWVWWPKTVVPAVWKKRQEGQESLDPTPPWPVSLCDAGGGTQTD